MGLKKLNIIQNFLTIFFDSDLLLVIHHYWERTEKKKALLDGRSKSVLIKNQP